MNHFKYKKQPSASKNQYRIETCVTTCYTRTLNATKTDNTNKNHTVQTTKQIQHQRMSDAWDSGTIRRKTGTLNSAGNWLIVLLPQASTSFLNLATAPGSTCRFLHWGGSS